MKQTDNLRVMKSTFRFLAAAVFVLPLLWGSRAIAHPQPTPLPFTPSQLQRINGALYRRSSQDFFDQGQRRLEGEINRLEQKRQYLSGGILKISPDLQVRPDFSQFEHSDRGSGYR
jgi:hypothetical protein